MGRMNFSLWLDLFSRPNTCPYGSQLILFAKQAFFANTPKAVTTSEIAKRERQRRRKTLPEDRKIACNTV